MLEYDTGSEHLAQLTAKLDGYAKLAESRGVPVSGYPCRRSLPRSDPGSAPAARLDATKVDEPPVARLRSQMNM